MNVYFMAFRIIHLYHWIWAKVTLSQWLVIAFRQQIKCLLHWTIQNREILVQMILWEITRTGRSILVGRAPSSGSCIMYSLSLRMHALPLWVAPMPAIRSDLNGGVPTCLRFIIYQEYMVIVYWCAFCNGICIYFGWIHILWVWVWVWVLCKMLGH